MEIPETVPLLQRLRSSVSSSPVKSVVFAVLLLSGIGYAAFRWEGTWKGWFGLSDSRNVLVVSGNIEAHESVLAFKTIQSRIIALPFDEGQSVKAGTLIARVEDADYRQQVEISKANLLVSRRQLSTARENLVATQKTLVSDLADLEMKKLEYGREQFLLSHDYVTTNDRDLALTALKQSKANLERDQALERTAEKNVRLAKAGVEAADASLRMSRIVLGYTTLVAPYDGVILVRQAEIGEIAQPGTPVVTLADLDHIWLRAYINETDIARVRFGAPAVITTDTYPGKKYEGHISSIASSAEFTPKTVETHEERVTLVYRIKIDIYNPTHELVPGLPADAAIKVAPP